MHITKEVFPVPRFASVSFSLFMIKANKNVDFGCVTTTFSSRTIGPILRKSSFDVRALEHIQKLMRTLKTSSSGDFLSRLKTVWHSFSENWVNALGVCTLESGKGVSILGLLTRYFLDSNLLDVYCWFFWKQFFALWLFFDIPTMIFGHRYFSSKKMNSTMTAAGLLLEPGPSWWHSSKRFWNAS